MDNTSILKITSATTNYKQEHVFPGGLPLFNLEDVEEDYNELASPHLSTIVEDIVGYIGGFVVRKIRKIINCQICAAALQTSDLNSRLISFKDRGGLVYPSADSLRVCSETEKTCRRFLAQTGNRPPVNVMLPYLTNYTFANLPNSLFSTLNDHLLDFETLGCNHVFDLTKQIIMQYLKIRLHSVNKKFNLSLTGQSVRQRLNKIILFKHQ